MPCTNDELRTGKGELTDPAPRLRPMALPENTRMFYGRSMAGAFCQGDLLIFDESSFENVAVGDVVAYRPAESPKGCDEIVHRVIAIEPEGLRVQGDSNTFADDELVTAESFVGRVAFRERGGSKRRVLSGTRGLFRARFLVWFRRSGRRVLGIGAWPYRALRRHGLVALLWKPDIQELRFRCGEEVIIRLMHGGRIVGDCYPGRRSIRWKKPYDLVFSSWRVVADAKGTPIVIRNP